MMMTYHEKRERNLSYFLKNFGFKCLYSFEGGMGDCAITFNFTPVTPDTLLE